MDFDSECVRSELERKTHFPSLRILDNELYSSNLSHKSEYISLLSLSPRPYHNPQAVNLHRHLIYSGNLLVVVIRIGMFDLGKRPSGVKLGGN